MVINILDFDNYTLITKFLGAVKIVTHSEYYLFFELGRKVKYRVIYSG